MTWTLDSSGTKTPMLPATATFTNASASIGLTNSFAAGDRVSFQTSSALPTNFVAFTNYYVIATGLTGSTFQVSATLGGSAITAGSAGTGTQTAYPEQVLSTSTSNASFVFEADTTNLVNGDLVEFSVYTVTLVSGIYGRMWKASAQHIQVNPHKQAPPVASDQSIMFTVRQLAGTARAFPWKALRV
jgi:hypothetical protein